MDGSIQFIKRSTFTNPLKTSATENSRAMIEICHGDCASFANSTWLQLAYCRPFDINGLRDVSC